MSLREYRMPSLRDKVEVPTNEELEKKVKELKEETKGLKGKVEPKNKKKKKNG